MDELTRLVAMVLWLFLVALMDVCPLKFVLIAVCNIFCCFCTAGCRPPKMGYMDGGGTTFEEINANDESLISW
jgi:hypothetical protein